MKAIKIDKDRKLSYVDLTEPLLADGDILVEPIYVGVCGTDLQMINGERACETDVLGHEGVAKVSVGNGSFPQHSYVTFSPLDYSSQDSVLGHSIPGLLQQRRVVTAAELERGLLVKLPADFDIRLAPLIEPLASTIYSWQLLKPFIRAGDVLVIGDGTIGQLAASYYSRQSARVTVITSRSGRRMSTMNRRNVRAISAADFYKMQGLALGSFDAALLAVPRSGAEQALHHVMQVVRAEGCIDLMGGLPDGLVHGKNLNDLAAVRRNNVCGMPTPGNYLCVDMDGHHTVHFCGHRGVSREHMEIAISELQSHPRHYEDVVTHQIPFSSTASVLAALSAGSRTMDGRVCTKVVVHVGSRE